MLQSRSPSGNTEQELREKLAAIEHMRWADWQRWCHEILRENMPVSTHEHLDKILERWDRQIDTPYDKLSDSEKASDMEQVDRYWPLIENYADQTATNRCIEIEEELLDFAKDVVYQYAYQPNDGVYTDGGLSTLEYAFSILRRHGLLNKHGQFIAAQQDKDKS